MKMIQRDLIAGAPKGADWKDVVRAGVGLLAAKGMATAALADAIFDATARLGAYYVLEPGLALAHAPPGPYCLKAGMAVVVSESDVVFNEQPDKAAHLTFVLSAPDAVAHVGLIEQFGALFTDERAKARLLACKTPEKLWRIYNLIVKD